MIRRIANIWILTAASLLLAGCSLDDIVERKKPGEEQPMVKMNDMFVSGQTEEGQTITVFRTNDIRYWTLEGMTVWAVWEEAGTDFTARAVKTGKSSGHSIGGYGIIFCHGEYVIEGIRTPVMLTVMINNQGQYIYGKVTGGIFADKGWWKTTPYLQQGTGNENEIKVVYDTESGEYCLEINGHEIERFRDEDEPALRGGKNGYIAVITPYDKFPDSIVDVYFLEDR